MKIERIRGTQATEVTVGARVVLVSYGTPVAVLNPGSRPVVTEKRFSVTTTKHINGFARRHGFELGDCTTAPQATIEALADFP